MSPRRLNVENRTGVPVIRTIDPEFNSWQCVQVQVRKQRTFLAFFP
jgi:hypothetical protein